MAEINTAYVSPAAIREANTPVKPISQKKEFESLIRDIRRIAVQNRAFSGDFIKGLTNETESSANTQRNWSWLGTTAQIAIPMAYSSWNASTDPKVMEQVVQTGSKWGDAAQSVVNATQFGYQANAQRVQQALTRYNAFDQSMTSIIQTLDAAQQRLQQKEQEEASNR